MCYGADSTVGNFEKESFDTAVKEVEEAGRRISKFISTQDKQQRATFVVCMN